MILPKSVCGAESYKNRQIPKVQAISYALLFIVCLLTVFRVIPDWICLVITIFVTSILDRKLLLKADYGLLATFVCFFVFVGNIARIDMISGFFSEILNGR